MCKGSPVISRLIFSFCPCQLTTSPFQSSDRLRCLFFKRVLIHQRVKTFPGYQPWLPMPKLVSRLSFTPLPQSCRPHASFLTQRMSHPTSGPATYPSTSLSLRRSLLSVSLSCKKFEPWVQKTLTTPQRNHSRQQQQRHHHREQVLSWMDETLAPQS